MNIETMRQLFSFLCLGFLSLIFFNLLSAQSVTRGPYLQSLSQDRIIVHWRSDTPSAGQVWYGTHPDSLSMTVADSVSTTEHIIVLEGLTPDTKYWYAVGNATAPYSGPENHYFSTPTPSGTPKPLRLWAIGDFGKGNLGQKLTRDAYVEYAASTREADICFWLGDNAYPDGKDEEYQANVFDSINGYGTLMPHLPIYSVPGNHDYLSVNQLSAPPDHTGPYYNIVDLPENGEAGGVPSTYELYYSFDYGNVHVVGLNSELLTWTFSTPSEMSDWLEADLAANTLPWTIVIWHQPPYSKGSHDSDDFWEIPMASMRSNYVPIVESYGVDMVINGHSHVYERSMLIKGHTGNSSSFGSPNIVDGSSGNPDLGQAYTKDSTGVGTVYAVVGNSGSDESEADLDHPAMIANYGCDTCWGSLVIDIDGDRLDGTYVSAHGEILDKFAILKTEGSTASVPEVSDIFSEIKVSPNPFSEITTLTWKLSTSADIKIELLDELGRKVKVLKEKNYGPGEHSFAMNGQTLNLPNGIWLIKISDGEKVAVRKVVKY